MAIILAGHSPHVHLLGVSTVAGNQTVAKTTQNALDVLAAAGLPHIRVVAGQAKPLLRPSAMLCPEIHGDSGLDGPQGGRLLPLSTCKAMAPTCKAPVVMFEAIQAQFLALGGSQRICLVCLGALTNAALLLILYPEVTSMIDVCIMGGCLGVGNTGPVMEFNIQVDPEAAKVVFESGVQLTMVPLEVTHTVLATPEVLRAIGQGTAATAGALASPPPTAFLAGKQHPTLTPDAAAAAASASEQAAAGAVTPFRHMVLQLLLFFADTYRRVFGFEHPPLHDPCAVAYVIAPELFKVEDMRVDIEVCSTLSAGQTVCDRWHASGRPKNCRVALEVDVPAFWQLVLDAVGRADAVSPLNGAQRDSSEQRHI